ncbi:hypothetical protein PBI_SHIBA_75 [Arthrobacter phage Shiba]|nr:hypothetical protein PBI_SHIBA_75 [Arthrobacter phage Shiba]
MNEFQAMQSLVEALYGELSTEELRGKPPAAIALALADRVVEEGWKYIPPEPVEVKEEWRRIPGFSAFESSNKGFIRHSLSREWVPVTVTQGEPVTIWLHDDNGRDVELELQHIWEVTWPKIEAESITSEELTDILPEATLTGKSTPVVFEDDEWRNIDCIEGLKNFEINQHGVIRNKVTGRVRPTEYDIDRNVDAVNLILNGKPINIVGKWLADAMWDDKKN